MDNDSPECQWSHEKPRKLGVDLQYRKSSAKPWLTNITDGLVLQWNQVSCPIWPGEFQIFWILDH